jgi:hypothetical protein
VVEACIPYNAAKKPFSKQKVLKKTVTLVNVLVDIRYDCAINNLKHKVVFNRPEHSTNLGFSKL